MVAKRSSRAVALLLMLPSAAFALGFGDIRLLSPLNAPLDAQIELLDATPEELQTLQAKIASRDMFTSYGLEWPVFVSSVQVKTTRSSDGRTVITLKSTDPVTEPFITLLVEVNWARGHLVREYTMLLDPPVFTPGQSAASNAPVAVPSAGAGTREGAIARGADAAPPAASAPLPGAGVASSPASGSTSESSASSEAPAASAGRHTGRSKTAKSIAPPPAAPDAGGKTHLVQRGETLSSIASTAAGSSENSPEAHSWMLAIYQANPRAFEQNMNVLHSGAVLRMPEGSEVAAVSPAAAATEIRRQYAAWRGGAAPEGAPTAAKQSGQLHLVTPSDDSAGPATAASSSEVKALKGRVHELEGQLSESKRLLDLKNAELADLQAKSAASSRGASAAPPPPAPPPAAAQTQAPPPPVEQPPVAQAEPPASATPPPAEEPAAQASEATPPPPPPVAETPKPTHRPKTVEVQQGGSLVDTLMDYWWALALIVVAVAGYFGFKSWRSRRQSEFDDSLSRLAVAGASSAERGFAAGDTAPIRPIGGEDPEGAFLVEESGTHQRPRFGGAAPAPSAARHVSTADETISSEAAINLDQGDPLAEADFHMAYGLYDQAADLIRIAINREPNRRDLKLKLLEVFFVWGNKEQFLQAARELAATRAEAAPGEWEKIVIMGKQLAPDDPLFAGGGTTGATAGGVDLDLEGGQSRVDFDLLGEPVPGAHGTDVDLDIGSALGDETGTHESGTSTDRNVALDSGFQSSPNSTGTTRQMTARIPRESDDDLMSEFGSETEGPTVEQPALTSHDNPTIRQKVAMALKQTPPAEQTAELAIDDLGLDLAGLDTMDQPGLGASSDAPTLVAGMDDRSRRIMEEAQRRAVSEDTSLSTGAWQLDENELDAALADGNHQEAEQDGNVTSRLSALTGSDVDYDLGDAHGEHATNGSGLDLDLGTQTVPDAAFTATQKLNSDDLALPDLEPVTMSEVGTKLDLARAYMDMGDPDGAKNILEEVLHEGSMTQKQEAQRLMESLPG
ncbi:MAG TPA: FimV/HubP family polar landmark protein [Steroidobacteraceae bacterium]|nr:FimV/HubP family polar landmark protein [Steroidobacteraceae bacterium]